MIGSVGMVNERTVVKMADALEGLAFSFIVLILLVMRDVQMELKEIRRELKRKDEEHDIGRTEQEAC